MTITLSGLCGWDIRVTLVFPSAGLWVLMPAQAVDTAAPPLQRETGVQYPSGGPPGRQSLMQVLISLSISHNAGVLLSLCAYRCHLSGNGADSMNSRAGWVAVSLPVPLPWAGCDGTNSMCRVTRGTPGCLIAAGAVVLAV